MVKLNLPTRPWVPQWLGIVTMFIVIFPITLLNGAYTGSMVEVSNTLGVLSEDITMAYYSASVGMAVAHRTENTHHSHSENLTAYRPAATDILQPGMRQNR
jgi:hypothetical protein